MDAIIYFHGYGSNGNSRTAEFIKSAYPDYAVITPTYNTKNANEAIDDLYKVVYQAMKDYECIFFVGSSLGGFIANYFSNKYSIPTVLINPCLDPVKRLQKYNPQDKVDCESFAKYDLSDINGIPKVVILGKKDSVIPYQTFMERYNSRYQIFINESMGHRTTSKEDIIPAINQILNNSIL
jgi:predicted esterase YcpF (UPF0227 family)